MNWLGISNENNWFHQVCTSLSRAIVTLMSAKLEPLE